jgi:hypothetical protein
VYAAIASVQLRALNAALPIFLKSSALDILTAFLPS